MKNKNFLKAISDKVELSKRFKNGENLKKLAKEKNCKVKTPI